MKRTWIVELPRLILARYGSRGEKKEEQKKKKNYVYYRLVKYERSLRTWIQPLMPRVLPLFPFFPHAPSPHGDRLLFFIASCFSILARPTGLPFPQLLLFILSLRTTSCVFFAICFWFTAALTRNFFGQCPRRSFNESGSNASFRRPDVTSGKNMINSICVNFLISIAHGFWVAEKVHSASGSCGIYGLVMER